MSTTRAGSGPGARSGSPSRSTPTGQHPGRHERDRGRRRARPARRLRSRTVRRESTMLSHRAGEIVGSIVPWRSSSWAVDRAPGSCRAASRSSSRAASGWSSASGEFQSVDQPGMRILTPLRRQDGEGRHARVPHDGGPAVGHHQGQRLAVGERHHLLPGDRREVGPLRDQRLPAGRRPALPHRPAGRLRRAVARPGALRARDDQQPHAGPHGRRHGEVGRAASTASRSSTSPRPPT